MLDFSVRASPSLRNPTSFYANRYFSVNYCRLLLQFAKKNNFLLAAKFRHDEKSGEREFFETLRLKVSSLCSSPSQAESKTIRLCVLFKSCKIFFNTSIVNAKKFSRTGTHVRVIMLSFRALAVDKLKNRVINGLSFYQAIHYLK